MEEIDQLPNPATTESSRENQNRPLWRQSVLPAAALTLLASCAIAINVHNPIEALGNVLITVPITFAFWWLICTFILWLWQTLVEHR